MPAIKFGVVSFSFQEANPANGETGVEFQLPQGGAGFLAWGTSFLTTPSAVSISLQISNDNLIWSTIDTSTNVSGEIRQIFTASQFVRAKLNSKTGGSGVSVNVNVLPASLASFGVSQVKAQFQIIDDGSSSVTRPTSRIEAQSNIASGLVVGNKTYNNVDGSSGIGLYQGDDGAGGIWMSSDGNLPDKDFRIDGANVIVGTNSAGGLLLDSNTFIQGSQCVEPSSPPADGWRLFTVTEGGKVTIKIRFPNGTVKTLMQQD